MKPTFTPKSPGTPVTLPCAAHMSAPDGAVASRELDTCMNVVPYRNPDDNDRC